MTTDKEELRKEFYKVMEYSEPFGNEYHSELFDWVMGKLEAKDKEIDFQKRGFDFLYGQAKQEITDLKAEIERLKYQNEKLTEALPKVCDDPIKDI